MHCHKDTLSLGVQVQYNPKIKSDSSARKYANADVQLLQSGTQMNAEGSLPKMLYINLFDESSLARKFLSLAGCAAGTASVASPTVTDEAANCEV